MASSTPIANAYLLSGDHPMRTSSASPALVGLLLANCIPIVGVLFLDWHVGNILIMYWSENIVIGMFNVLKMLKAEGAEVESDQLGAESGPPAIEISETASKVVRTLFFCFHFGIFTLVHGVFVFLIVFANAFMPATEESLFQGSALSVLVGFLALVVSHGISFVANYLGRGEYRVATVSSLFGQPYPRVMALHFAIIIGSFLAVALDQPVGLLIVLVVSKLLLDLLTHTRERLKFAVRG